MPLTPLNQMSGMPQMGAAFEGWQTTITIEKIVQTVVDFVPVNTPQPMTFQGVIQPLNARAISLKAEGQRAWTWLQIHVFTTPFDLTNNDIIVYNGKRYKVMNVWDWHLNNFVEYHVVEEPEIIDDQ